MLACLLRNHLEMPAGVFHAYTAATLTAPTLYSHYCFPYHCSSTWLLCSGFWSCWNIDRNIHSSKCLFVRASDSGVVVEVSGRCQSGVVCSGWSKHHRGPHGGLSTVRIILSVRRMLAHSFDLVVALCCSMLHRACGCFILVVAELCTELADL